MFNVPLLARKKVSHPGWGYRVDHTSCDLEQKRHQAPNTNHLNELVQALLQLEQRCQNEEPTM